MGLFGVTLGLFALSISLHWIFVWYSYAQGQEEHNQPLNINHLDETMRDIMENWRSEFLQLMWQVLGLVMMWYIGCGGSCSYSSQRLRLGDILLPFEKKVCWI